MPEKTEQQLMALNRSQLIEYIGLLQKDSQYVGQLAVESKTKLQRVSLATVPSVTASMLLLLLYHVTSWICTLYNIVARGHTKLIVIQKGQ